MALIPRKTSVIILTLPSFSFISFVLNCPILLAIILLTGMRIATKATPDKNAKPTWVYNKYKVTAS